MRQQIRTILKEALTSIELEGGFSFLRSEFLVQRPKDGRFGEYTSNVALIAYADFAHALNERADQNVVYVGNGRGFDINSPISLAENIRSKILEKKKDFIDRVEVAGPGHLNIFLSQKALSNVLEMVVREKDAFGNTDIGKGIKVNNEFISANPTGPLHLGNGRGGFFGDALSNVLRKAGFEVENEYYVNDAGEQIVKLGHSVLKDNEAVYGGEYIEELAGKNKETEVKEVGEWAAKEVLEGMIKKTLDEKMKIRFDAFISEKKDIVESGLVDRAVDILKERGFVFENEGALWFRSTEFGDDKDRVLVKQDGTRTYFASDCGYILSKMERGFGKMIETWGADHHGYISRFRAAARALGFEGEIQFNIVQLVRLVKDGKEVRMSKRAGNVVTIDELIERVGHDVARFFFLLYSPDTHMNFDMGLAEEHSQKNPVFYVQYAHARLVSILRKASESGLLPDGDASLLTHEKERELLQEFLHFPEMIEDVAMDSLVHRLPHMAVRLSDTLHSFYDACRVIDEENKDLSRARLKLVLGATIVLRETLRLVGVSAPEKM